MKKILLLVLFNAVLFSSSVFAQDIVKIKNGAPYISANKTMLINELSANIHKLSGLDVNYNEVRLEKGVANQYYLVFIRFEVSDCYCCWESY